VKSREIQNIRSHAQKFLRQLLKFIENKKPVRGHINELTMEEAEFYYGILNKKLNKFMKKPKPVFDELSGFEKFKKSVKKSSDRNSVVPPSIVTRFDHKKFSFKSLLDEGEDSDDSTGSNFNL